MNMPSAQGGSSTSEPRRSSSAWLRRCGDVAGGVRAFGVRCMGCPLARSTRPSESKHVCSARVSGEHSTSLLEHSSHRASASASSLNIVGGGGAANRVGRCEAERSATGAGASKSEGVTQFPSPCFRRSLRAADSLSARPSACHRPAACTNKQHRVAVAVTLGWRRRRQGPPRPNNLNGRDGVH